MLIYLCVCVRDVGQSQSHHCVLALAELNSISVFLPSPSLHSIIASTASQISIVMSALNILHEEEQ